MNGLLLWVACAQAIDSPLSPARALEEMRIEPGLRVELAAAEPEVQSPVAVAFDEAGRLWVVEMLDYPTPDTSRPALGRLKILEDLDEDGRFEKASIFADGLLLANGLMPWRGGTIVTASGQVVWLRDTDGDGRADRREPLYEGFTEENPQLRASFPTLGMDNGIYVANGARGGKVRRAGRDGPIVELGQMDFRFDPIRGGAEAVSGFGQFGLTFDDWGRRFVCTNRNHLVHLPMANRYFARNPFLSPPPPRTDNQGPAGAARVFPISRNKTLSPIHAGAFTASCGIVVYGGDLWGSAYAGNVFTCEPTGNLVHREILTADGATWTSRPANEGIEFLASADGWFRPVSLAHGPDGALYVVDMYREEVEHPQWVPPDQRYRYNFDHRKDLGRIWRIVPAAGPVPRARPRLGGRSTAELAALLEHPGAWWRMTAHRLILERQDGAAWAALRERATQSAEPRARVHALWLLEGLRRLDVDLVLRLIEDPHPGVRESAVLLAERWIAGSTAVQERVLARAGDDDARVRFQAALTLGAWDDDRILDALTKIAARGAADRWTRLAVQSAVPTRAGALLRRVEDPTLLRELAALVGARGDGAETNAVIAQAASRDAAHQVSILKGLADGAGRRGAKLGAEAQPLLARALEVALDPKLGVAERADATRLLAHVPWETASPVLERLLGEAPEVPVQLAAVAATSAQGGAEGPVLLLKHWERFLPPVRREVLEAMSRSPERIGALLDAIEAGRVASVDLGAALTARLVGHADAKIRGRAAQLLPPRGAGDLEALLERYRPALSGRGDARRGQEVFQKHCASCHRIAGAGAVVGPDISDSLSRSAEQLLRDILDPNAAIDTNYITYEVRTRDGRFLTGYIAEQTASSLTLRRGADQQDVVLTQDVTELRSTKLSLMPEGLDKGIDVEAMRDLLTFLKNWRELK
jgi:putative membrane-bound dehydrogenase-like protein